MNKRWLLLGILLCSNFTLADLRSDQSSVPLESPELEAMIGERSAVFYARDLETDRTYAYSIDGIDQRHRPFSTFKIPNLLIALETGVEQSLQSSRDWNPELRPATEVWPQDWAQDQTLLSAFRKSVVWYFRDIALEVGGAEYRRWLEIFNYGNAEAPDENDLFWLRGPLEISVVEQTEFISGLIEGRFPVSDASIQALIEASRLDENEAYVLHGKTGAGSVNEGWSGPFEGWLVGWVERPGQKPVVYALFVEGPSFSSIRTFRKELTLKLLQQAGVWLE